jgi:hypothetical protein
MNLGETNGIGQDNHVSLTSTEGEEEKHDTMC